MDGCVKEAQDFHHSLCSAVLNLTNVVMSRKLHNSCQALNLKKSIRGVCNIGLTCWPSTQ